MAKEHPMASYWRSDAWIKMKADLIQIRGAKCENCGKETSDLAPHHLTYKNFKNEQPEDLMLLCRGCHMDVHGLLKKKRKQAKTVRYTVTQPRIPNPSPPISRKPKKLSPRKKMLREIHLLKQALRMSIAHGKGFMPCVDGQFTTKIENNKLVFTIDIE